MKRFVPCFFSIELSLLLMSAIAAVRAANPVSAMIGKGMTICDKPGELIATFLARCQPRNTIDLSSGILNNFCHSILLSESPELWSMLHINHLMLEPGDCGIIESILHVGSQKFFNVSTTTVLGTLRQMYCRCIDVFKQFSIKIRIDFQSFLLI